MMAHRSAAAVAAEAMAPQLTAASTCLRSTCMRLPLPSAPHAHTTTHPYGSHLCLVLLVVVDVLHPHLPAGNCGAVEVVHCQHGAALVLIRQEGKAPGLATLLVPHQVDIHQLAILGKHSQEVALRQIKVQPTSKYVGAVLVPVMPAGLLEQA